MKFSVVIATYNEAFHIASSLKRLRQISTQGALEVIVVDGRSDDDTAAQARPWADQVLRHERPNCGEQLHLGAQKATGSLLLFLPGDAQLPGNWQQALERTWLDPALQGVAATAFTAEFGSGALVRLASLLSNAEVRLLGRAGLYHGLCTTDELYRRSGGFPPLPCLAEQGFCARLRQLGRVALLPEHIHPSASRLHRYGVLGCAARRLWRELRFKLGAPPEELWRSGLGE